tara:strand:- start:2566 stop:3009 length:444 start_codon:yes stop_codon:yes gene_type:complete
MKHNLEYFSNHPFEVMILSITGFLTFICSYFYDLTFNNYEQYLGILSVTILDGVFGILAGVKREGFKTYKAIKILKTTVTWILILTTLLSVEKGFTGSGWLSETIMIPFIVFQIISALKNASMAGYIKIDLLNNILDKIDKHKGKRA